MRILHVDLGRAWRGGQQQVLTLAQGLARRGHEQSLLVPAGSPLAERGRAADLEVVVLPPNAVRWRAAAKIRELLRRIGYDILHLHEAHAHTAAWLALAPRATNRIAARRVAYLAGRDPLTQAKYRRGADCFIAISEFVRQSLLDSGVPAAKVEVVYDGIELPPLRTADERCRARASFGFDEGTTVLGCVGYLLPEKGQDRLVEAMTLIARDYPRAQLLLAGDGPLRQKIRRLVHKLGLEERVHLTGFLAEVERAYLATDVFVFPSLEEPLGSSLLAAMAWGLPVVAVGAGAVPEVIDPNVSGVLVPEAKAPSLAEGVKQLLEAPERWTELGRGARARIESEFTAAIMVARTEAIYRQVVEGK